MKRERTKDFDVLRQGSTISIVERRSGVASSFVVPSEEAREALARILSEPLGDSTEKETEPPKEATAETALVEAPKEPIVEEKKTTTKKRTKKESASK